MYREPQHVDRGWDIIRRTERERRRRRRSKVEKSHESKNRLKNKEAEGEELVSQSKD
jgi:hypothetical protein